MTAPSDFLRVHGFESVEPGPRLVVLGGVHGDETCGTAGIERMVGNLDAGRVKLLRGGLSMVPVANPLARRMGRREGERNLNRSFRPGPPGATDDDYEAGITRLLCPLLDRHDVLLDLHSFQSQGEAFAMIGPRDNAGTLEPFSRAYEEGQLALHLRTPRVVEGWLDIYADGLAQRAGGRAPTEPELLFGWGTNEYMRSRGGYAVTLECGQHQDPAAPQVAYDAIRAALVLLGMAEPDPAVPAPSPPQLLRLVSVADRLHDDDQFVREWATFDAVSAGEPLAMRADGSMLRAARDGFIVFPNSEAKPGTEWFYFAVTSDRDLARLVPTSLSTSAP
ncbi:MAG: succinylglutamate desuccinylase/aspartoacylase family protein [Gammaproteobacteria bacterium]|nr:succinylglutamate desuccinylase/aspartoacylase family protein [Gammaproteobacteria bacterium]MBU1444545.1 succinylglutamate desuccinylase/aspartoacylase family protein [Gammaproteobacteria bacterium]MBU2286388.1 succinylglutamate desuccinylase/aspartoacylase family protein [Gammaproteobacteria bacterium]MBU2410470.1 succinylglutamate desuccinylase/aspartoacylase family protein [Gammaproteobacteria bacterium]